MPTTSPTLALFAVLALASLALGAEEEHHDEHGHDEGAEASQPNVAFAAAAVVHSITVLGVCVILVPMVRRRVSLMALRWARSFAAGALLSAAFFLMLPEAFHLIESAGLDETTATAAWAVPVLAGISAVLLLDVVLASARNHERLHQHDDDGESEVHVELHREHGTGPAAAKAEAAADEEGVGVKDGAVAKAEGSAAGEGANKGEAAVNPSAVVVPPALTSEAIRLLVSISTGDALHNFADGTFIGAAFRLCSPSVGWAVLLGTVAHELSQEISDVLVLRFSGWSAAAALVSNFTAGATIYLGVAVALFADIGPAAIGIMLAVGGGVFIYTAAVECLSHQVQSARLDVKLKLMVLFVLGAASVSLVLLNHSHCDASLSDTEGAHDHHAADDHADH